ncbi:hypothetical protein Kisp01_26140 [Kineosporia sp. NBRC 101677]|uniref:DNA polymerase III subunit beta family protein n=1 Tax=Kineosporia sp. NBRC 101677 TaxID=3032197 RepID=UPI0024A0D9B2|nr:MerR family transcriptional regulator [Kineosporia sp. NBRC 101677]GLY15599.1 hypothetical protein Kisp01_26140 [Kineosporia sp. NBRC 101677]
MPTADLMPIGTFAQRTGLTASALRFYADAEVLAPARVDPSTGYRFYSETQVERAVLVRRLREIGMPLPAVSDVLAGAVELVEEHVRRMADSAESARLQAALIVSTLNGEAGEPVLTLSGPVFAAAVDQVLAATARQAELPILNAVRIELADGAVTLTATDRYRLSTRTLTPLDSRGTFAVTVDADDLRAGLPELRSSHRVSVSIGERALTLHLDGREGVQESGYRIRPGDYPDHRALLEGLPEVTTRVLTQKSAVLAALETGPGDRAVLRVSPESLLIGEVPVEAVVSGTSIVVQFELTNLYPAISTAIGTDLVVELRGAALPATIRSADHGDLTTLAMPVA